jgi:FMN-dependent NADH-azoreductase
MAYHREDKMAKVLIVYGHPAAESSFNNDLKKRLAEDLARRGHKVIIRDLYGEAFEPVLSSDDLAAAADKSAHLRSRPSSGCYGTRRPPCSSIRFGGPGRPR